MEGTVSRLEEKIGESQKRMEDLLKSFMGAQGQNSHGGHGFENNIPRPYPGANDDFIFPGHSHTVLPSDPIVDVPIGSAVDVPSPERHQVQSDKDAASSGGNVDEFLKVLLHEQDHVLGFPGGPKSPDTVPVSGQSGDFLNRQGSTAMHALGPADMVVVKLPDGPGTAEGVEVSCGALSKNVLSCSLCQLCRLFSEIAH